MPLFDKSEKDKSSDEVTDGFKPEVPYDVQEGEISDNADGLQRHLANRQIQLIAIGGSIGTALFVSIGNALYYGGPGSLFIAYVLYAMVIGLINNCIAEMSVAFPVSGGFIRLAGHWCDDAFGFMAGWNFFLYEALLIPFEITAFIKVCSFWTSNPPVTSPGPEAGIIIGIIVLYALINILAVKAYGEAEFWLSGGKVILIFMLFCFTFITMVGGNPQGYAYGFVYWTNGHAFKQYLSTGDTGRFEGFLACVWSASFCIVGPEYLSIVAAEARRPRIYIKTAFKTIYIRFAIFFMGGALAAGIVCASYWNALADAVTLGKPGAASSPYVIAMQHMRIKGLPDLVNALMLTSIFSAGNTYTYCAVRNLYGLALEGRAPKFLAYTTKKGVPIWCFCVVMIFPFLAFLSLSNGSAKALTWLINITTAGGIIDYIVMSTTYIQFYNACKAQGLDRKTLPYTGWFQPYCAYIGLVLETLTVIFYGYSTFRGSTGFSVTSFFTYYILVILDPILFIFWKLLKKTKWRSPHEVDLVWERPTIDAYEATFIDPPIGFWREIIQMFGLWKQKGGNDKRIGSISA